MVDWQGQGEGYKSAPPLQHNPLTTWAALLAAFTFQVPRSEALTKICRLLARSARCYSQDVVTTSGVYDRHQVMMGHEKCDPR